LRYWNIRLYHGAWAVSGTVVGAGVESGGMVEDRWAIGGGSDEVGGPSDDVGGPSDEVGGPSDEVGGASDEVGGCTPA
jgi:hypothetical protein